MKQKELKVGKVGTNKEYVCSEEQTAWLVTSWSREVDTQLGRLKGVAIRPSKPVHLRKPEHHCLLMADSQVGVNITCPVWDCCIHASCGLSSNGYSFGSAILLALSSDLSPNPRTLRTCMRTPASTKRCKYMVLEDGQKDLSKGLNLPMALLNGIDGLLVQDR